MLFQKIDDYLNRLDTATIPEARKAVLKPLGDYIGAATEPILLNFICTHNSRRSHLSQIWAAALAAKYGFDNIFTFSGGTEATAIYPKIVETLENCGFEALKLSEGNNPVYALKYAERSAPVICFSKKYDDRFNPADGFVAIMTCSSADEGCPVVFGAAARFAIKFEDPKISDGTPEQTRVYAERCHEIARDLAFVFEQAGRGYFSRR